jgi:hypothetical protein
MFSVPYFSDDALSPGVILNENNQPVVNYLHLRSVYSISLLLKCQGKEYEDICFISVKDG